MTKDTGGPAFPCHPGIENPIYDGMTMRDEFAKAAMQSIINNDEEQKYWATEYSVEDMLTFTAERAYKQADAMMKARQA